MEATDDLGHQLANPAGLTYEKAEKRKQDLLDEKHQAIEKKRKTAGDDLDRWSAAVRKAAGGTDEQLRAALVAILAEHKTIVERERV